MLELETTLPGDNPIPPAPALAPTPNRSRSQWAREARTRPRCMAAS